MYEVGQIEAVVGWWVNEPDLFQEVPTDLEVLTSRVDGNSEINETISGQSEFCTTFTDALEQAKGKWEELRSLALIQLDELADPNACFGCTQLFLDQQRLEAENLLVKADAGLAILSAV